MNIETLNPYVIKIMISARKDDSISSISRRMGLSYGWTQKWVKELIKEEILKERWRGFTLQENNEVYKKILKFVRESLSETSFYYLALSLMGIKYCLTKTDAVYFWTEGKYNIARYREFYPIFVNVDEKDKETFNWYCKKLGLNINTKHGVFYSPEILKDFNVANKEGYLIEPLDETISFMQKNIYNFEPALEMIDEMYKKGLKTKYKEMNYI
ncbi:MAG: hypothetical protein AABX11_07225 [Nanoarchaeota archaeon]